MYFHTLGLSINFVLTSYQFSGSTEQFKKKCVEVRNYLASCCVEIYIFSSFRGNSDIYMSKRIKAWNECVNILCIFTIEAFVRI